MQIERGFRRNVASEHAAGAFRGGATFELLRSIRFIRFSPHAFHLDKKVEVFAAEGCRLSPYMCRGRRSLPPPHNIDSNQCTTHLHTIDSRTFLKLDSFKLKEGRGRKEYVVAVETV